MREKLISSVNAASENFISITDVASEISSSLHMHIVGQVSMSRCSGSVGFHFSC